ncbi:MAG: RagB/SusD family nutrient uptake outer membrane protein [Gemmatimonadetes bacterium]|nr:RagB/SusD family nutrient uptake outer membrane protein [Gemmatimonadota bacterium]
MNIPRPARRMGLRSTLAAVTLMGALYSLQACTDLDESPFSSITPDNFYQTEEEVRSGLASVYNQFNAASTGSYHYFNTISSDEQVIPVRGQDWFDNGTHLESQRQLWQPNSPSGLGTVNGAWNTAFTGVARANVLLAAIENLPVANKARTVAELRVLRAYFYYQLIDLFGGVPIVTTTEIAPRARASRAETFAFVEKELTEARADLPVSWPSSDYGRVTRGAADAILASMYLNAQVFTGTVTAAGLQRGTQRWQDAVDAANRVIAGPYSLNPDWFANFRATNHTSPEMILVSARRPEPGASINFISDRLHYNQFSPAPNNGRAAEPPTVRKFDPADKRASIFLTGPQVHLVTRQPVNDRSGARLNYTIDFRDITQATEGEGARVYKWPFDPARVTTNHGNDYPLFRLGEILLIKAEALNELGQTGQAVELVNTIRARVFDPRKPLSSSLSQAAVRDAILDERLFELMDEGKRRADLVRHGKWTNAWYAKQQREPYRVLLPIPQTQVDANPLLEQNPGY